MDLTRFGCCCRILNSAYPAELKHQIVELVHAGRSPAELAREFEPTAQTIQKRTQTTRKTHQARKTPDLVKRDFTVATVNKLWVADITYLPTWSGFLYLSVVLDAFSRRVVGWAMATHLQSELVLSVLNMALYQRRPEDVIHHSDQGVQYTSIA